MTWSGWTRCQHVGSFGESAPIPPGCLKFQRLDRIKWEATPGAEVTVIYQQLGSEVWTDDHWFFLMQQRCATLSVLIVFVDPGETIFSEVYRRKVKQIGATGYWTISWNVCDSEVGAACRQNYTITVCGQPDLLAPPGIGFLQKFANQPARSSDNCLEHYKVRASTFTSAALVERTTGEGALWCGHIGPDPVFGPGTCLPCAANIWVETSKGCRRVRAQEWMKMKGHPSPETPVDPSVLFSAPSHHLWATIGDVLFALLQPTAAGPLDSRLFSRHESSDMICPQEESQSILNWRPPSFNKRGRWYRERVSNLRKACRALPPAVFEDGLRRLALHSQNYSDEGPKHLVLLWWEWPPEHHDELRLGLSMNFLQPPPPGVLPNAPMNEEERATAIKFVDELCSLGVLEPEPWPGNVVNTCPLFLVPKPGQPGQYRCIADMKKGGQNACVGADPVQMTAPVDILPRLYQGGYSATLDIAKYFHMFPTIEAERAYLGCIHPSTGAMLRYGTLPMGAGNSPGASGRFGAVFLRLVTTTLSAFQGAITRNDIASGFAGVGYHPKYGVGRVLIGPDGLPACILWIHVDDLLIHGPTKEKCTLGLHQVLDLSVRLGFICQRCKTVPPCQRVKYCGFLYDTTDSPTMLIPEDKITRAIGQVSYIQRPDIKLSRIGLAITVGNLQSLVPPTPSNIGATFLRHLYNDMHGSKGSTYTSHLEFYYERIVLSPLGLLDLAWWSKALLSGMSARCVPRYAAHLGVAWGDGSGSGTGGTFEWVAPDRGPLPTMRTWMGSWSPIVHRFSSNWRELRTLVATLHPSEQGLPDLDGVHLFYFTDNSSVYHITRSGSSSSPQLHKLVQQLKLLELTQGCRLDVIHVPGRTMIAQGTDGQSRGVWVSPLHCLDRNITADLFRPAPPSNALLQWVVQHIPDPRDSASYMWVTDTSNWTADMLLRRHCVWSLYPTTARQGFLAAIFAWIEAPSESSHVFLVPRLLQRDFGRVNKHIIFLGLFDDLPLPADFSPLVPFLLFYLPPFVRSLKSRLDESPWMDNGAQRSCPEWVRSQMEYLRGLSGAAQP